MNLRIVIGNHHFVSRKRLEDLVKYERGMSLVGSVENGKDLYLQIKRHNPNLVILNATMPGIDSLHLLEIMSHDSAMQDVNILFIGAKKQQNIMDLIEDKSRVWFMSYEKSDEDILNVLKEIGREKKGGMNVTAFPMRTNAVKKESSEQLQLTVTKVMHELGIPAHIKGYMYLRSALMMAVDDMSILNAITKQLYPEIAKRYESTPSRVERAIRHAIETAWERGSFHIMNALFCGKRTEGYNKPTNSEFIALIADKIRLEGTCESWTY